MAVTTTPALPQTPKGWEASIGNGDASAWKLLLDKSGNGAASSGNGAKITSVMATGNDSSSRIIQLAIVRPYTGATVTVASPGVVSWSAANGNNVAVADQVIWLDNGDSLPTGLSKLTTYYVISAGFTFGTSFELASSVGGAAINTSASQSGTHIIAAVRPITAGTLAVTGGTDGVTAALNLLGATLAPGLPLDNDGQPYLLLEPGDYLAVSATTTVTSAKMLSVHAIGALF